MGELRTFPGPEVLARPCPVPTERWHRDAIASATGERAAYHRAWLRHLEKPNDPASCPLVSVVIPVRDGNAWIRDAVESALAQTYPMVEVLVVDDGSLDPPDRVLGGLDGLVRILHQPPRGVAAARNHGVREARGELVQLLDADDLLDEDALARKLAVFREVADAELCISSYRTIGGNAEKDARTHRPPPLGDELCPTRDLLATTMERYPFHTSTLLAARWVLLDVGPMDELLPQGEDTRHWFRLSLRGTKVVALNAELGTRRFVSTGLTSKGAAQRLSWARVGLLNSTDTLREPELWIYLGQILRRSIKRRWSVIDGSADPLMETLRGQLLSAIASLPMIARERGLSARPPLALLRQIVEERAASGASLGAGRMLPRLAAAVRTAWAESEDPTEADVELWLRHRCRRSKCVSQPAFDVLTDCVDRQLTRGQPGMSDEMLCRLASRGGPRLERRWRLIRKLAPRVGPRLARVIIWAANVTGHASDRARRAIRLRTRLRQLRDRLGGHQA